MFKGLFLLEDYEPLKGMDPFFYLFFLSVCSNRKVWGQWGEQL